VQEHRVSGKKVQQNPLIGFKNFHRPLLAAGFITENEEIGLKSLLSRLLY